jgi:hypothetical protein
LQGNELWPNKKNMWFQLNPNKKWGKKVGRRDIETSTVLIEK